MELVLITPESEEWEYMWDWLASHPINEGIEDPSLATNNNESWQYMGSLMQGKTVLHQFRHRCHPLTNDVYSLILSASESFTNEQIAKKFKL